MSNPGRIWGRPGTDTALCVCAVFGLFSATLIDNHSDAEDALRYVLDVTAGTHLFYANHLFYNAICRVVYDIWLMLGHTGNALLPMQLLNAASGAATVGVIHRMVRRAGFTRSLSLVIATAPVSCYAFWLYSVEAETYLLPMPWIMAAFGRLLLQPAVPAGVPGSGRSVFREAATISLLLCVPTLINQQAVLYYGPAALGVVLGYRGYPLSTRLQAALLMLGLGAAISIVAYAIVAFGVEGVASLREFVLWTLGYAKDGMWTPWSPTSPVKGVMGFIRSIVGIHSFLAFEIFDQGIRSAQPGFPLWEERFLAARLPPAARWMSAIFTLLASGLGLALVAGLFLSKRHDEGGQPRIGRSNDALDFSLLIPVATAVLLLQTIFIVLWLPQNVEFWITTLPWIFLLAGFFIHRRGSSTLTWIAAACVVSLGIGNAVGSILPLGDPGKDYWRDATRLINQSARKGDLVFEFGGYEAGNYIEVFSQAAILPANYDPKLIRARIVAHPGRVLVSSWVLDPPPAVMTAESDLAQTWDRAGIQALMKCYQPNLKTIATAPDQTLWELLAPIPACN